MPIEKSYDNGVGWTIHFDHKPVVRTEVILPGVAAGLDKKGNVVELFLSDKVHPSRPTQRAAPDRDRLDNGCMVHRTAVSARETE